jgi:hypothetical protein
MIRVEGEIILRVLDMFRIIYIKGKAPYIYYKQLQAF